MKSIFFAVMVLIAANGFAQRPGNANLTTFGLAEDSMKTYSRKMVVDPNSSNRFTADSIFVRLLVKSLRQPYSFNYPFDSLETVSKLYPTDSMFRIFSWQYNRDDTYFRQRGAIQMRTADGSLKLFPLIDISEFTDAPMDSVRQPNNWIGAIYYGLVTKTYNNKTYYTLLGFDDNNARSTKKWIEVLTFNADGQPEFGGPFFTMTDDKGKANQPLTRFSMEFKKEGRARLNYDREMDMIVYDHLISEDNQPNRKYTLVPDGDYEGFKWVGNHWQHISKVFDFKLKDGEAPLPEPLKDDTGISNEQKLIEQSIKNQQKGKPKE